MFNVIVTSTPEQRRIWIDEARRLATGLFHHAAKEAAILSSVPSK